MPPTQPLLPGESYGHGLQGPGAAATGRAPACPAASPALKSRPPIKAGACYRARPRLAGQPALPPSLLPGRGPGALAGPWGRLAATTGSARLSLLPGAARGAPPRPRSLLPGGHTLGSCQRPKCWPRQHHCYRVLATTKAIPAAHLSCYDHTTTKAPDPIRTRKLNVVGLD